MRIGRKYRARSTSRQHQSQTSDNCLEILIVSASLATSTNTYDVGDFLEIGAEQMGDNLSDMRGTDHGLVRHGCRVLKPVLPLQAPLSLPSQLGMARDEVTCRPDHHLEIL